MSFNELTSWLSQRITDEHGVWPWAERNQGLLSVAALIVALAIAVYEAKRAARAESRATAHFVDWVVKCPDRSIELTTDAMRTIDGSLSGPEAISLAVWKGLNGNALATLEEILPLRPTNPDLAHHVNRLVRSMAFEVKAQAGTQEAWEQLEQIRDLVQIGRDHVLRLRPKTDRERIAALLKRLLATSDRAT